MADKRGRFRFIKPRDPFGFSGFVGSGGNLYRGVVDHVGWRHGERLPDRLAGLFLELVTLPATQSEHK